MQTRFRPIALCTTLVVLTFSFPLSARAQGFVSPLIGYDFGGDSGCPEITGCEDKKLNVGVGLGTMGSIIGFELDISYARDFFGSAPSYSSSVLTLMGNVLLGPRIGPAQPYFAAGLGLIKSHIDFEVADLIEPDNNDFGWNIGGGLMIFPTEHVGVRGDIRHFHAFQDLDVLGLSLGDTKLDFSRASGAVVFRF
jgi:opacity protein-like surface antigen